MKHITIENGLNVHLLQTKKFKTTIITVLIRTPLTKENATYNSVLAGTLGCGNQKHQTALEIAKECEKLYGAELEIGVVKKGEEHLIQLYFELPTDRLAKEPLFDYGGSLLGELLFEPLVLENGFKGEYVKLQKERQKQVILGRSNDRRKYAKERCIEIMCENEAFGVSGDGYIEILGQVSPESLYNHYKSVINESAIDIGIIGDIGEMRGEGWAKTNFSRGSRNIKHRLPPKPLTPFGSIREVKEALGINQGKLAIGICCGDLGKNTDFYKLLLFSEILGGGSQSRLFKNIREKRSMCYYISSSIYRAKSIMVVEAGIDEKDYRTVLELVQKEVDNISGGKLNNSELELAKAAITSQMETLKDSPQGLMDFFMTNALLGDFTEINELKGIFGEVTCGDIINCAARTVFDTAFFLV